MARVTTAELHKEIEQIKSNHLAHMMEDIDDLKDSVKENRKFFTDRLDRLDSRIWALVLLTLGTLLSTIIGMLL